LEVREDKAVVEKMYTEKKVTDHKASEKKVTPTPKPKLFF
jgi:hypothetical protein